MWNIYKSEHPIQNITSHQYLKYNAISNKYKPFCYFELEKLFLKFSLLDQRMARSQDT